MSFGDLDRFLSQDVNELSEMVLDYYTPTSFWSLLSEIRSQWGRILEIPQSITPYYFGGNQEPMDVSESIKRVSGFTHIILYHGTSSVHKTRIETEGVLPREITGEEHFDYSKKEMHFPDSIYFWQLKFFGNVFDNVCNHAIQTSRRKWWHPLIVRGILDISSLRSDEDLSKIESQNGLESLLKGGVARIVGKYDGPMEFFEFPWVTQETDIHVKSFGEKF